MRGVCRGPQAPPVPTLPGQAGACTLRALSMDLVAQPGVGASPRLYKNTHTPMPLVFLYPCRALLGNDLVIYLLITAYLF